MAIIGKKTPFLPSFLHSLGSFALLVGGAVFLKWRHFFDAVACFFVFFAFWNAFYQFSLASAPFISEKEQFLGQALFVFC